MIYCDILLKNVITLESVNKVLKGKQ